jgi:hypothetical protein
VFECPSMSQSDALTIADFPSGTVEVACDRCGRQGRYSRRGLAAKYGAKTTLPNLLRSLAGDSSRAAAGKKACGAVFPALGVPAR